MTQHQIGDDGSLRKDVFFRSHVVELITKIPLVSTYNEPQWPEYALVFDTETTLDPQLQALLFGFYRVCRLKDGVYQCVEEGILHADDLDKVQLDAIKSYARSQKSEVVNKEYDENIKVYTHSEFAEQVFFNAVRTR